MWLDCIPLSLSFVFFQVETIGDAYVVAGGIHNTSGSAEDARKVALMGLGMIDDTKVTKTPDGTPIQVQREGSYQRGPLKAHCTTVYKPLYDRLRTTVLFTSHFKTDYEPLYDWLPVTLRLATSHFKTGYESRYDWLRANLRLVTSHFTTGYEPLYDWLRATLLPTNHFRPITSHSVNGRRVARKRS